MGLIMRSLQKFASRKHFDEHIAPDIEEVLDVAAYLDITEFEVFHLAYSWWHGQEPTDAKIEPFFVRYMFQGSVPHWVRQFTRMALRLRDQGRLDPEQLGVQRLPPADAKSISKGIRYGIILAAALSSLIVVASLTQHLLPVRCMFPPCY
jgi:hypothetical protein